MKKENIKMRCCGHDERWSIPEPVETVTSGKAWTNWGADNQFPNTLYECYTDCSILGSVINAVSDYVAGSGVTGDDPVVNREGEKLSELLQRVVLDYVIFGQFSIQIIRNKLGEIKELNYIDVRNCRLNEDGDKVYYCKAWGKYARNVVEYDRWQDGVEHPVSVFYYKNPKARNVYAQPMWGAALRDALTCIEASKSNYMSLLNGFAPNTIISFTNGTPSDDVQDEVEALVMDKFTGSDGSRLMLTWSDSKEQAPEVKSFTTEDYTQRYEAVMNASKANILAAFRVSAQLVGIASQETGFSNIEYRESFNIFKTTVVRTIQSEIERAFKKIGYEFTLNEFMLPASDENNTI